jgi:hypothetical protein
MQQIPFRCSDFKDTNGFSTSFRGEAERSFPEIRRKKHKARSVSAAPYVPEEAKKEFGQSKSTLAVTPPWQPPPAGASPFILCISEGKVVNVSRLAKKLFWEETAEKVQGPELPGPWPSN